MKAFIMYTAAIAGGYGLSEISQLWFGTEWIFGLLIVAWFALFLQAWKRIKPGGAGLIFVTFITLLNIGYVFFVQYTAKAICSLLIGLLLMQFYKNSRDVVLASMAFVLSYFIINLEMGNTITLWILFALAGIAILIGYRCGFRWLKRCFIVVFGLTALYLLIVSYGIYSYILIFGLILVVVGLAYKISVQTLKAAN